LKYTGLTYHWTIGTEPSSIEELQTHLVLILLARLSRSVLGVANSGSVIVVGEAPYVAY
jgi:hypothetical protein